MRRASPHRRWASRGTGVVHLVWWACLLLWPATAAHAQESATEQPPSALERAGVSGSVRVGYWSSTQDLDSEAPLGASMVWLKATRPLSERVSFLVEGWGALRGPIDDAKAAGEVREAFVDVRLGHLDVRVGRQILAWGRADGVNPTDNLTGEDLTLLVPDDDDRRLGTTAARASYYLGDVSVTGLWLPEFRGHRFPLPPPPAGLRFTPDAPEWPGDQWAVRVEQTGRAVDWSVSYFRGRDLSPDLGVQAVRDGSGPVGTVRLSHHPLRIVGADMAASLGRFGLRAEGAYVDTEDSTGRDPYTKNPFVFLVVGSDRTLREHLNVNVQYLYRFVVGYRPPAEGVTDLDSAVATQQSILNSQMRRVQHGMSLRAEYKWLRDTLEAECATAGYFAPRGLSLRPKVAYAVSDSWKVLMGAELFRGESSSIFGLLRPNSTAYLEARWSF